MVSIRVESVQGLTINTSEITLLFLANY